MIGKQANFLLHLFGAATHPNQEFREWANNPERDTTTAIAELQNRGFIIVENGDFKLTPQGVQYLNRPDGNNVDDLIRQIKNILPKNPNFRTTVNALSDSALIRMIFECLGEIGERSNPEKPESIEFWQKQIDLIKSVVKDATPDSLWERRVASQESFANKTKKTK